MPDPCDSIPPNKLLQDDFLAGMIATFHEPADTDSRFRIKDIHNCKLDVKCELNNKILLDLFLF